MTMSFVFLMLGTMLLAEDHEVVKSMMDCIELTLPFPTLTVNVVSSMSCE